MTEQTDTEAERPEREIEFMGRMIWVRFPRPEQILVWQRTLDRLQSPEVTDWNGAQVLAALERTRKIIDSVLVHRVDIDWLDDQMLDGAIGLQETAQIITKAVESFAEDDNRASRRAAAKKTTPAKKAVRKRV